MKIIGVFPRVQLEDVLASENPGRVPITKRNRKKECS